jgi:hypothetical protein
MEYEIRDGRLKDVQDIEREDHVLSKSTDEKIKSYQRPQIMDLNSIMESNAQIVAQSQQGFDPRPTKRQRLSGSEE